MSEAARIAELEKALAEAQQAWERVAATADARLTRLNIAEADQNRLTAERDTLRGLLREADSADFPWSKELQSRITAALKGG